MGRKAVKDTFAIERVGDVEVRRQVIAGSNVPDHYEVEDESAVEESADENARVGYHKGARTERVNMEVDGGGIRTTKAHEPGSVERVNGVDADNPHAEGEEELAAKTSLLSSEKSPPGKTSAEKAEEADKETAKTRDSEEGDTPAQRIEKRLQGKPSGRAKAKTAAEKKAESEAEKS